MVTSDKPVGEQLGWSLQKSSYLFSSPWFKLRQDLFSRVGKGDGTYTYIEHPGSVLVVPVTPDRRVILIRSYRYTLDTWCWEVPAGTLSNHSDASPEVAAIRELREEAGAKCGALYSLGKYYLGNGYANHLAHFFVALGTEKTLEPALEVFEHIDNVSSFSFADIEGLIREGTINDGDSAFALLLALQRLAAEPHLVSDDHMANAGGESA